MKLTDFGVIDNIVAPVIGFENPEGEDIRYDAEFEEIENEI